MIGVEALDWAIDVFARVMGEFEARAIARAR